MAGRLCAPRDAGFYARFRVFHRKIVFLRQFFCVLDLAAPWPRAVKTTFVAVVEAALASDAQAAFTEEVVLHRTMSNPCVPRVSKSVDSNPRQLSQLSQLSQL